MREREDYGKEGLKMKEKLTHNLGLKILALLFSISLWLISININDPVSPRNYTIQVQLLNINSMINAGKYVEVQDDTDTVRVTVRASRSVLSDFSEKNLVATADINDLTENNRIPIQVTTTKTDNKIESIKVNGVAQTITSKAVDITVPTNNNQLANGAGYQTSSEVQAAINNAISGITGIDFQVVESLPGTGVKGVIYLVSNSGTGSNIYDEYIWVTNRFEKIGTTEIDLSNYYNTTNLLALTNQEIDTIISTSTAS